MDHVEVRTLLSAGEESEEAHAHVAACGACRAWSEALSHLRAQAPALALPDPPGGLADRALVAVREASARGMAEREPAPSPQAAPAPVPWWRRVGGRLALAAALAAAVAVAAVAIPGRTPSAEASLAAAARKTAAAGTARVELSGTMTATISLSPEAIPLPTALPFPSEDELRSSLDRLPPEIRAQMEQFLRSATSAPIPRAYEQLPLHVSVEMDVRGVGEIVMPDRLHLKGTMTSKGFPLAVGGEFELIVIGDEAWVRLPATGNAWIKVPASVAPFNLTVKPAKVLEFMRGAGGVVQEFREETLDGGRVRHLRINRGESASGPVRGTGRVTMDAWIGVDDGILHKATFLAGGTASCAVASAEIRSQGTLRLFDFGADVEVAPPAGAAPGTLPGGIVSVGIGEGGFGFSFNLDSDAFRPRDRR